MSRIRVCFLGTPAFAVTCLQSLLRDEHFEVVGVVTQPDRPSGRKMQLTASAVKTLALSQGIQVITPEKVREESVLQQIAEWKAEVAVVVAYGQILPEAFMKLFPFGAVNVHGSLLPHWRGAAPIQRSIEAGESETGVALQKIVKELDAGDILGIRKMPVDEFMTAMQLHDHLAQLACELLEVELMDYVRGNLVPVPQEHNLATYAKKIDKAETQINWSEAATVIHNKIRAYTMGPGSFTFYQGKRLKVLRTQHRPLVQSEKSDLSTVLPAFENGDLNFAQQAVGEICKADERAIYIKTGQGILALLEVQPESKSKMSAAQFLSSHQDCEGEKLGE